MGGWIKFEKAIETDPRVLRMARALVTQERFTPAMSVTLVVGALTRLWSYMDTHGRDDDSLDLSPTEVDELVGLPGFATLMPDCWLAETADGRVELPNFQAHNSADAKKTALTAKRVARYRAAQNKPVKRTSVTPCNAPALPDQTRPDQTIKNIGGGSARARVDADADAGTHIRAGARADDPVAMERLRLAYPRRAGRQPNWPMVQHHVANRIADGATWEQLEAGTQRYAAFVAATGKEGTEAVMAAVTFFSAADRPWAQPWDVPPAPATDPRRERKSKFETYYEQTAITDEDAKKHGITY